MSRAAAAQSDDNRALAGRCARGASLTLRMPARKASVALGSSQTKCQLFASVCFGVRRHANGVKYRAGVSNIAQGYRSPD